MKIRIFQVAAATGLVLALTLPFGIRADQGARETVVLNNMERNFMFGEMRGYVVGIKKIIDALVKDDMKLVAAAARPLGMSSMMNVPSTLMQKVPSGFMRLGMPTHAAFDEIATVAERGADSREILTKLGNVMGNCVACHSRYQIRVDKE